MQVQNNDFYKGIGYYKRMIKKIKENNYQYDELSGKIVLLEIENENLKKENEELKKEYEELKQKSNEECDELKKKYDDLLSDSYKKFCSI